ncbi:MAG: class F sortase [Chloroflexi bacterium]|nr:class F sortase [Chloroflexota bacterium]
MMKYPTALLRIFHKFIWRLLLVVLLTSAPLVAVLEQATPAFAQPSSTMQADQTASTDTTPVRLIIPSLKIDTTIESVGKAEDGEAGVPQSPKNVAWYNVGPKPGETGNAVISGHLDDKVGPAIFWRLRELKVADTITVVDKAGKQRNFKVLEVATYPYAKAPLNKIFGFDLEHDLNLITCTGRWNNSTHTYSQRLVVYTRLVEGGG